MALRTLNWSKNQKMVSDCIWKSERVAGLVNKTVDYALRTKIVENVRRTIFTLEKTEKPIFKFQPISDQYLGRTDKTSTFWFCLMPWSKGFFLRRVLQILFIRHFSRFIYDSMNMKALLALSRDLSTDKQNRGHRSLRNSTWSDKSH